MRQEQVNIIFIQSNKKVSSSRDIHSNENHSLLDNPLSPIQDLNTNFHLEPKSRKPEIQDRRKYDVGASKNAKQAFSTPRLSSHFLLSQILGFRFFSPSNKFVFNSPFSPIVDLDSQKKEKIPYPRCGFEACLRCERAF